MKNLKIYLIYFFLAVVILGGVSLSFNSTQSAEVSISAMVPAVCGNDVIEPGEQCEGANLNGQTCGTLGYAAGTLTCQANCSFNTSGCQSGGGGPTGGGFIHPIPTKVVLKGKAYPLSPITVLQDGKVATGVYADAQANFTAEITNITAGIYTFGVWAQDKEGRKSIVFSFTVTVNYGMITTISGIFLPPTIDLEKTLLQKGEPLNILGQTAPESDLVISIGSSPEIIKEAKAMIDGTWLYGLDTIGFDDGLHTARAKAISPDGLSSSFSKVLSFYIGKATIKEICPEADLNKDGRVNLIDFSILLYWWGKANACADQNQDGTVNLRDFSIMMYHWTG